MREEEINYIIAELNYYKAAIDDLKNKYDNQSYILTTLSESQRQTQEELDNTKRVLNDFAISSTKAFSLLLDPSYKDKFLVLTLNDENKNGEIEQRKYYIGILEKIECEYIPSIRGYAASGFYIYPDDKNNKNIYYRLYTSETTHGTFITAEDIQTMRVEAFDDADSARLYAELNNI